MNSRGFWNGMLAGGILGVAAAIVYMSPEKNRAARKVTGKVNRARRVMEDLGAGVASAWKK